MYEQRSREEAEEIMRSDIVALLSRDPHCWLANLIGQNLLHD